MIRSARHRNNKLGFDRNPMQKRQDSGKAVTLERFYSILNSGISLRDRAILQILFETGCSISELAQLRVKDYSPPKEHSAFHSILFSSPKRESVISSKLAMRLQELILQRKRAPEEYLFSQQPHKPFSVKRIEQIIDGMSKPEGRAFTPQGIRYLHIRHAAQRGLHPDTIAAQTGLKRQRIMQILDEIEVSYVQSYSIFFEQADEPNEKNGGRKK